MLHEGRDQESATTDMCKGKRAWVYLRGAGGCHAETWGTLDWHHYHRYDHLPLSRLQIYTITSLMAKIVVVAFVH